MTLFENPACPSRSSRWPDRAPPTRRPLSAEVLIRKRPSAETLVLSRLHQQAASLLKTEPSESPSYLRSRTPASREQLQASELLSALLRGQIGVGGRCEWMRAITPGFSQDCARVSSHSQREDRAACAVWDPGFSPFFLARYHSSPADQVRIFRPGTKSMSTLVPSGASQALPRFLTFAHSLPPPTQVSQPPSEGATSLFSFFIDH